MKNKEVFNVGDWVIGKEDAFEEGSIWHTAFQIDKLIPVPGLKEYYCYNSKGNNNYLSNFRKALSHELPFELQSPLDYEYLIPLLEKLNIK